MFKNCGEFLYPAFPGDPGYYDFITDQGTVLPGDKFPGGGPTALAEFFGDHMVVNGKVWPKMDVEPRNYRLRLLNGCDSRFLVLEFVKVDAASSPVPIPADAPKLEFFVIGSDQGFKTRGTGPIESQTKLVMAPSERFDVIVDFNQPMIEEGGRVIMKNSGGDEPFGGFPAEGTSEISTSEVTNRIMAFDIISANPDAPADKFDIDHLSEMFFTKNKGHPPVMGEVKRIRRVALFEGLDEYGRLQPALGTAEPATDFSGAPIFWPDDSDSCNCDPGICVVSNCNDPETCGCAGCPYTCAGLTGQVERTVGWNTEPPTENPKKNDAEKWEIWNVSADAHPVHLHLVDFEIVSRHKISYDTALPGDGNPDDENFDPVLPSTTEPKGNGIYLKEQPLVQHNGKLGKGYKIVHPPDGCPNSQICYGPELPKEDFMKEAGSALAIPKTL